MPKTANTKKRSPAATKKTSTAKRPSALRAAKKSIVSEAQTMPMATQPAMITTAQPMMQSKPVTTALALRPKPMITMLGVMAFAFAIGIGIWNASLLVGQETSIDTVMHHEGRVAGATVSREPGTVTIVVTYDKDQRTFALGIDQAMSAYNALRLANSTTLLHAQVQISPEGTSLASVADIAAPINATWHVMIDGQPSDNLDTAMVHAGSVMELTAVAPL